MKFISYIPMYYSSMENQQNCQFLTTLSIIYQFEQSYTKPKHSMLPLSTTKVFVRTTTPGPLFIINPISHELWNDVITRGGAIMARMDSSHPEAVCRHPKAQK